MQNEDFCKAAYPAIFPVLKSNHSSEVSTILIVACQEMNSGQPAGLHTAGVETPAQSQLESPDRATLFYQTMQATAPLGFPLEVLPPPPQLVLVLSESSPQSWDRSLRVLGGCEEAGGGAPCWAATGATAQTTSICGRDRAPLDPTQTNGQMFHTQISCLISPFQRERKG